MNYNNITQENFQDYFDDFKNSLSIIDIFLYENDEGVNCELDFKIDYENTDPESLELYELKKDELNFKDRPETVYKLFDIRFKKLFTFSHNNDIFFQYCSSKVYENTFEIRFKNYENKFVDVSKFDFVKIELEKIANCFVPRFELLSNINKTIFSNAKTKKVEFLQSISKEYNFDIIDKGKFDLLNLFNNKRFKVEVKNDIPNTIKPKPNKSLLFNGTNLNIKDRFRILNKVLDFDKKVHPLNISESEKNQLLAYILGIDKDNARKLMSGTHDAKDNDLTTYFNDLGLSK